MPIYVATALKGNQKGDPEFVARGIEYARSTSTKAFLFASPDCPQLAYKTYTTVLPAFMKAEVERKTVYMDKIGYTFSMPTEKLLPMQLPPLVFSFKSPLSDDKVKALQDEYSITIPPTKKEKDDKRFVLSDYEYEDVKTIEKRFGTIDPHAFPSVGTVNKSALIAFQTARKLLTAFLLTQHYPAFEHGVENEQQAYESIPGFISAKRRAVEQGGRASKRRTGETVLDEEDEDMEVDDQPEYEFNFGLLGVGATPEERIPRATPKYDGRPLMGLVADVPNSSGFCFPYFDGLLEDDFSYIPGIMDRFFRECLGGTKDEIITGFAKFRASHGILARTEAGRRLQHLFVGIKLAVEGQARLFPIVHGVKYHGFALLGARFTLAAYGKAFRPLSASDLRAELTDISLHDRALENLMNELNLCKRDQSFAKGEKVLKTSREITSARVLQREVLKRIIPEEKKDVITRLAADLAFPERFWTINVENVLKAMTLIVDDALPEMEVPMYLGGGVIVSDSVELAVLSAFGPIAFSLKSINGKKWQIPKPGMPDAASELIASSSGKSQVKRLATIIIQRKDLFQAARDVRDTVNEKAIWVKTSRESSNRGVSCGGKLRDDLWEGLKKIMASVEPEESDLTKRVASAESKVKGGEDVLDKEDEVDLDDF